MTAPVENLEKILKDINATAVQRCFLRNYVGNERVDDLRYAGKGESTPLAGSRMGLRGSVIHGTIDGRGVRFIVGDSANPELEGLVIAEAVQENGRLELYRMLRVVDRFGGHLSDNVGVGADGVGRRHEDNSGSRPDHETELHQRLTALNSYADHCEVPVAQTAKPQKRFEPIA